MLEWPRFDYRALLEHNICTQHGMHKVYTATASRGAAGDEITELWNGC
jgi:hypothetical protein